jgi:hypothetical protein
MADSKIIITKDLMDKVIEELTEYRAIGTVKEFKMLKEKDTPKSITKEYDYSVKKDDVYIEDKCSKCGCSAYNLRDDSYLRFAYCPNCGQAIDWQ